MLHGALDNIAAQQHPALRREISGDEKAQAVAFIGDDGLVPEAGKGDPSSTVIEGLGIGLT